MDDALYREVKQRAARSGRTAAAVLEDAVRVGLRAPAAMERSPYRVEVDGAGGLRPGIDLADGASVREALDDGAPLDALR